MMKGFLATLVLILALGLAACSAEAEPITAPTDDAQRVSVAAPAAAQVSPTGPAEAGTAQGASSTADEIAALLTRMKSTRVLSKSKMTALII